jgi:hypothetical protein
MRKRLTAGIAALVVVSALVALPAAAQAAPPHWFQGKVEVTSPTTVTTGGLLTFTTPMATIRCTVTDAEEIWNPIGGGAGEDSMLSFALTGCKVKVGSSACPKKGSTPAVVALGLPWRSILVAGTPIRDEFVKVGFQVACNAGAIPDEFFGSLSPAVGKGKLVFGGPGSGNLEDAFSNKMEVAGNDTLVGKYTAV